MVAAPVVTSKRGPQFPPRPPSRPTARRARPGGAPSSAEGGDSFRAGGSCGQCNFPGRSVGTAEVPGPLPPFRDVRFSRPFGPVATLSSPAEILRAAVRGGTFTVLRGTIAPLGASLIPGSRRTVAPLGAISRWSRGTVALLSATPGRSRAGSARWAFPSPAVSRPLGLSSGSSVALSAAL